MDEKRPFPGYNEVPHTADIAIDVSANSLADLFIEAANGLYHILGIQKEIGGRENIHLEMEEMDIESLLVSFLNELLYYVEMGKAVDSFSLKIGKNSLCGDLEMASVASRRRDIKAVTYNEIKIHENECGFKTRIVFDI